jgi:hypothetical protein
MFRYGKGEVHVVTTRFSVTTWAQNERWRTRRKKHGCLYGQPRTTGARIPSGTTMIVIEMNNDVRGEKTRGRVEGLGLCVNRPLEAQLVVYGQWQYDRVFYAGSHRLDREELPPKLVQRLEYLCFAGQGHLKRGIGFTSLPQAWISIELARELRRVWRNHSRTLRELKHRVVHVEEAPCCP